MSSNRMKKNYSFNNKQNVIENSMIQEQNINLFLTGESINSSTTPTHTQTSFDSPRSNKFSSPMMRIRNLKKRESNDNSPKSITPVFDNSKTNLNELNSKDLNSSSHTTMRKLKNLNDSNLFGSPKATVNTHSSNEFPPRTSSLLSSKMKFQQLLSDSSQKKFKNSNSDIKLNSKVTSIETSNNDIFLQKQKDSSNLSIDKKQLRINTDTPKSRSLSIDINQTPVEFSLDSFSDFKEPVFTPQRQYTYENSRSSSSAKCCLCQEAVTEKTVLEKILDLKCGHVAHDSCIHLYMVVAKESNGSKNRNAIFPLCEICDDEESRCIPEDQNCKDELVSKYLLYSEDDEQIDTNTNFTNKNILPHTFSPINFDNNEIDYLKGLPSPDSNNIPAFNGLISKTTNLDGINTNERNKNINTELPHPLSASFKSNAISPFSRHSSISSKPLVRKSILRQSTTSNSTSMNGKFLNEPKARQSILHRSSISRESTLSRNSISKKNMPMNSPKPIVKRLQPTFPTSAILSSVNSSVGKLSDFFEEEDDNEFVVVQIDTPSVNRNRKQSVTNSLLNSHHSLTITSDNLIKLVSYRLKTVQELIDRHPNELNKKHIDSDLGLLRIVDTFNVSQLLEKNQTYEICKCFLFEKMLLLEYDNGKFQKIKITNESVNVEAVDSDIFRVSCLSAADINIFNFKLTNQDFQKLEKWVSALLNFDLEFHEETLSSLPESKKDNTNKSVQIDTFDNDDDGKKIVDSIDMIVKRGDLQISNLMPIKNNLKPKDLIVVLQIDSQRLIKKSENHNLINSIKALKNYYELKKGIFRIVVLDETLKILSIGAANDILCQLNGLISFSQIRGKKLNGNLWSSLVMQKYYSETENDIGIVVLSNSEMNEHTNCLFKDFFGSQENLLKVHIGYLNVDYSDFITDLVEINTCMDLMEIICYSFDIEFGQDDCDNDESDKRVCPLITHPQIQVIQI
ncbi:hypothetical protein ACO0SA_004100 [Hanseniaspora valbyensis]